jgi:hypothetical protein
MKKLTIFLAVLFAAFLLVGCDNILESLYPEFKQSKGGSGSGNVIVEISYDSSIASFNQYQFQNGNGAIAVKFVPFSQFATGYNADESYAQTKKAYYNEFSYNQQQGRNVVTFTFPVTKGATYKAIVWLDTNNDNQPSPEGATTGIEPGTIVYTQSGDYFLDLSYHKPSDPNIFMGTMLSAGNTVNWQQYRSDPYGGGSGGTNPPAQPRIEAPYLQVPSGQPITLSSRDEFDPDGWIVDRAWTIQVPGQSDATFSGMQYLSYTFTNSNASAIQATVKLKVKDNDGNWSPEALLTLTINPMGSTNQVPVASIQQGAQMYVNSGEWIYLSSSSFDPDGQIYSYLWTIGGQTFNSYDLSYQVPVNGGTVNLDITASLVVTDNQAAQSTNTASIIIHVYPSTSTQIPPPFVDFISSAGFGIFEGTSVTFTDASTTGYSTYITQRRWYVNGTVSSYDYNFYYFFSSQGTYTVRLEVEQYNDYVTGTTPRVHSTEKTITVASTTSSLPGSQANPYIVSSGGTYAGWVGGDQTIYYKVSFPGNFSGQNLRLTGLTSDIDLYAFSDSGFLTEIDSSTAGGSQDELIPVNGYTEVWVEVYGYATNGGPYTLVTEALPY